MLYPKKTYKSWISKIIRGALGDKTILALKSLRSGNQPAIVENSLFHPLGHIDEHKYAKKLKHNEKYRTIAIKIETINTCNNKCIICAYDKQSRAKEEMGMGVFEKTIKDYSEMGGGTISFTPVVGEVFLDKSLIKRLQVLENYPNITSAGFFTNASIVYKYSDEDLSYILSRIKTLAISIYGIDAEEYETLTRRKKYTDMLEGVRRILVLSPHKVTLHFRFLKKRTEADIEKWFAEEIESEIRKQGRSIGCQLGVGSTLDDYADWSVLDSSKKLPFDATWMSERNNTEQCLIPLMGMGVSSNGKVTFCPCANFDQTKELIVGDIRENTLLEIYNSDQVYRLWNWEEFGVPNFCKHCKFHLPVKNCGTSYFDDDWTVEGTLPKPNRSPIEPLVSSGQRVAVVRLPAKSKGAETRVQPERSDS